MASTRHTASGAMSDCTARSAEGMDTCNPRATARRYVAAAQGTQQRATGEWSMPRTTVAWPPVPWCALSWPPHSPPAQPTCQSITDGKGTAGGGHHPIQFFHCGNGGAATPLILENTEELVSRPSCVAACNAASNHGRHVADHGLGLT